VVGGIANPTHYGTQLICHNLSFSSPNIYNETPMKPSLTTKLKTKIAIDHRDLVAQLSSALGCLRFMGYSYLPCETTWFAQTLRNAYEKVSGSMD